MIYIICNVGILTHNFPDGSFTATIPNVAVGNTLLEQINGWIKVGVKEDDVIDRLRLKTVPSSYTYHTWTEGL